MAKKKKKLTPKDDLIESLMNDVQDIHELPTQHGEKPVQNLFLDDEESAHKNRVFGLDTEAAREPSQLNDMWQQVQDSPHFQKDGAAAQDDEGRFPSNIYPPEFDPSSTPSSLDSEFVGENAPFAEDKPAAYDGPSAEDDKTINIQEMMKARAENPDYEYSAEQEPIPDDYDAERTVAVEGFANRQPPRPNDVTPKVSLGALRGPARAAGGSVYASADATLLQSESLKLSQQRILELEKEIEKYRQENEELASAGDIIRDRCEELTSKVLSAEKEKQEVYDSLQNEMLIMKGTLQHKDSELAKAKLKVDELETRLKSDFKKIRVRERELENRLELVKAEKSALLRAKDENILDLKRKIDHLQSELDNYRSKVLELNKTIDINQEQFKRTVRALRLALSNLEVKEENVVPLKKAD